MTDQLTNIAILTTSEVEAIKRYVSLASRLRTSLEQMKEYWGDATVPVNYEELTRVYGNGIGKIIKHITEHAGKWPSIEVDIKALCEKVLECSNQFKSLAEPAIYTIENMPGYADFSRTIKQEEDERWEIALSHPIYASELEQVFSFNDSIKQIVLRVKNLEPKVVDLSNSVLEFKKNLMNGIQPEIDDFVKLDTTLELDNQLFKIPMSDGSRTLFSKFMGVIRGIVIEIINTSSSEFTEDLEKLVTSRLHPNHAREYSEALDHLTPVDRAKVEALISQTKKGHVLLAQLESLHDWLNQFDTPLSAANKGVGQIRTLWITTTNELDSINSRVSQVTQYSTLRNIVRSLNSSLQRWKDTSHNVQLLKELLDRKY